MKALKRIIYTILGLLLVSAVSLVGVILYAEYSGRRFQAGSAGETANIGSLDGESRLAYDENGNLAELPGTSMPQSNETASTTKSGSTPESAVSDISDAGSPNADISDTSSSGTDVSSAGSSDTGNPTASIGTTASAEEAPSAGDETERLYIMDMNSGLFHTENCSDASSIAQDQRSERSTTREKVMNAGYEPCPSCNP